MPLPGQPIGTPYASENPFFPADAPGGWVISESAPQYRPRHPEQTAVYQLFENHFDSYVRCYEERFEARSGPLRPVVVCSVEEFLACGRLQGGFARIRCPKCHAEHLLAFSCRTRNLCASCQAKRAVLFAEKLTSEILAPVPHRHWTFSIPRVLRSLFERDRKLLGVLSQTAYAAILKSFQALFGRTDVRPGCVVSLQTFGAYGGNWNPHAHALVSDGVFSPEGEFLPLPSLDPSAVMQLFRRLLLERLHQAERLSEAFMRNLLSWTHPGFSAFAGPPVDAGQTQSLESQARYITRPGLSMDALKKQPDGSFTVQTPPDPRTGVTSITLDPLEWIHRIVAHIPDPGQHTRRSYGAYSNRSRVSARVAQEFSGSAAHPCEDDEDSDFIRERRRTWARLLRKIFEVDPMLCSCGAEMKIISIITEPRVVDRILRHLQSEHCRARDPFQCRPPPQRAAARPQ
jgi:hypothetical protein